MALRCRILPHIHPHPRSGGGLGLFEQVGGGGFVDVIFAAVVADLGGHAVEDDGDAVTGQGDCRGARGGLAVFADGAFHGLAIT